VVVLHHPTKTGHELHHLVFLECQVVGYVEMAQLRPLKMICSIIQ
jgi:hypothetical protein